MAKLRGRKVRCGRKSITESTTGVSRLNAAQRRLATEAQLYAIATIKLKDPHDKRTSLRHQYLHKDYMTYRVSLYITPDERRPFSKVTGRSTLCAWVRGTTAVTWKKRRVSKSYHGTPQTNAAAAVADIGKHFGVIHEPLSTTTQGRGQAHPG
ncbi:hypothetical protein HBI56_037120 [Parastagonospora nodorum]|uniref:Uncharacterized protein n=2 Tax=Phaeosphaeria nodorum (strain SN15 / ATCC MYA-4574 / FGSC 10173) TaxID=321614 RepID=A0A7U2EVK3_PHANO|nr:hypothetical protein SNOG_03812 [Parastagonospora nodorum SN15]KAH3916166.1 hypothetical protein HBH56_069690 [Parastagonospora nodorum]EAT89017.1 hypothetical protein SNOG_03812 [Parastagonospora nodorum SN15]KAH3932336.1 hypothetical protein HBH54_078440 [Parastagonospora nodorum]KAH3954930.1 hypothetical protein HBH53_015930 [Parastagonospora nodorum]KAH3985995.1 hypothetical protein HBH52_047090 [Parastagonospora nodorum]